MVINNVTYTEMRWVKSDGSVVNWNTNGRSSDHCDDMKKNIIPSEEVDTIIFKKICDYLNPMLIIQYSVYILDHSMYQCCYDNGFHYVFYQSR